MIWLVWFLLLQIEIFAHYFFIEVKHKDITPDNKFAWSKVLVVAYRVAACFIPWLFLGVHLPLETVLYILGCLFLHLLIFPVQLNKLRGKDAFHFGNGFFDQYVLMGKWMKDAPFMYHVGRLFMYADLAAGMIYAYYNPHLL